jgi:hypothetical protein
MSHQRGVFDIINGLMLYFVLLVGVWGYAFGWYLNEIGARPWDLPEMREEVYGEPSPPAQGAWDPAVLLKGGQIFNYRIHARKDIDLSYQVLKERKTLFTVEATARIKTSATTQAKSSLVRLDIRDLLIQERFSVDKGSGRPTSQKYTSVYWNMEACQPTRYYFQRGRLQEGSAWRVPNTDVTVTVGMGEYISGFYTYPCRITKGNRTNVTMWVSREVPLLIGFQGEDCMGRGDMTARLVEYTSESGETFHLDPGTYPDPLPPRPGVSPRELKWS